VFAQYSTANYLKDNDEKDFNEEKVSISYGRCCPYVFCIMLIKAALWL